MIHVTRRVGRNILWAFGRRRGFLHGCANASVLGHQTLFECLVLRCRHTGGGTGWKQRETEQAGSDLDFHSLDFVKGKCDTVIITIIDRQKASTFSA